MNCLERKRSRGSIGAGERRSMATNATRRPKPAMTAAMVGADHSPPASMSPAVRDARPSATTVAPSRSRCRGARIDALGHVPGGEQHDAGERDVDEERPPP
jgi:hypothetical protein